MKRIINTENAPAPIGPYSQAVEFGNTLYTSGQIALDSETGLLVNESINAETKQVMANLKAVLEAAGYSFGSIVKTTIYLSDMNLFSEVNEIYATYFDRDFPARETVQVAGLPKSVNVEISVIACK